MTQSARRPVLHRPAQLSSVAWTVAWRRGLTLGSALLAGQLIVLASSRAPLLVSGSAHASTSAANLRLTISLGTCVGLIALSRRDWMLRCVSRAAGFGAQTSIVLGFATLAGGIYVVGTSTLDPNLTPSPRVMVSILFPAAACASLLLQLDTRPRITIPAFFGLTWLLPAMVAASGQQAVNVDSALNLGPHLRRSIESSDTAGAVMCSGALSVGVLILAALTSRWAPR